MVMGHSLIETFTQPMEGNNLRTFQELWQCEHKMNGEMTKLIGAIKLGMVVAVIDSFFQDQHGTAAWSIEGEDASTCLRDRDHARHARRPECIQE